MEIQLDVDGFDQVVRAIENMPGLIGQRIQGDGMAAAARVVRDAAKVTAEFSDKTGALRASIKQRRRSVVIQTLRGERRVPGGGSQVIAGGPGARQAFIIEYGREAGVASTGRRYPASRPRPYLEPALLSTGSNQVQAAGAAMVQSFAKIGRDLARGTTTQIIQRLSAA